MQESNGSGDEKVLNGFKIALSPDQGGFGQRQDRIKRTGSRGRQVLAAALLRRLKRVILE